ncbi:MAG: proline--tRNA ligase [Candidatus Diapherotrites archaeon]|nr:proline--tRNA ligase [Candidatus Diapherotrites archaeon]
MAKKQQTHGLTEKKEDNFSEWYNQVALKAELADYGPIKGFMVIRPNGYHIWEKIQAYFNPVMEKMGVQNAYFPLLIPESFFKKEAKHAEGFAPELAWLEKEKEITERLAIRPTSETIMYDSYARWVQSWRDLPLRINQWCNVLRWEVKQTKLFLRTREFLWQEGHCAYETEAQCVQEARMALTEYQKMIEELLAIPVLAGEKTEAERFAGAKQTFTLESFMPDGRALQMATSHNLGQNFSKTFGFAFEGKTGEKEFAWQNSWGFSTRLIGALIMVHADNQGLVLPPQLARHPCVIVPILFEETKQAVLAECVKLREKLKRFNCLLDDRDYYSSGFKFNEHELKGIPLRIELGPKDLAKNQCVLVRRDTKEKKIIPLADIESAVEKELATMQQAMLKKSRQYLHECRMNAGNWNEFVAGIESKKLVEALFCGKKECEEQIRQKTLATSRCIPFDREPQNGSCVHCNQPATQRTLFARAY